MDSKAISGWIRQARYRAKKRNIYSNLDISKIQEIMENFNGKCAYCDKKAETLDHPFPLKDTAPNVPANILPICKSCKTLKKTNDIVWLFAEGKLREKKYLSILESMFSKDGGDTIRDHIKLITGM